jgi:hypothetical protein
MGFIILESPYKTDTVLLADKTESVMDEAMNILYGRACLRDCLLRGEAVFGSHLLYTLEGVLDDANAEERRLGINLGFEVGKAASKRVFYLDRGFSFGMRLGFASASSFGQTCEMRLLGGQWDVGWAKPLPPTTV